MGPSRLLIFVSHPIQYFVPLFRELARRDDISLLVLYRSRAGLEKYFDEGFQREIEWDIPLLEGYRYQFLRSVGGALWLDYTVLREVGRFDPQVVLVHGYSSPLNLAVMGLAQLSGRRVLMRGDTRLMPYHSGSPLKRRLKKLIFRLVDGCVSVGSENRKYYESLGVRRDDIYFAPFSVDNAAFDLGIGREPARVGQREAWGIEPDSKVILFASKLVGRKRAADLLAAMEVVTRTNDDVVLVIAGTGPEEEALRAMAATVPVRTIFAGFRNQSEMPALLAASDIFVLPSEDEPWGLIVNEAMAAGLPIVVSDDVGAAPDLVAGKGTGIVYPAGDVDQLVAALDLLLKSPDMREDMGRNARNFIRNWDVAPSAEGIVTAAHAVVRGRR